jgi:hypothetical protein
MSFWSTDGNCADEASHRDLMMSVAPSAVPAANVAIELDDMSLAKEPFVSTPGLICFLHLTIFSTKF